MNIRKSTAPDFENILRIYACAREKMKKNGNPKQWGDNRPTPETVARDIEHENSYVIEVSGKICGVFALIIGDEPTYQIIDHHAAFTSKKRIHKMRHHSCRRWYAQNRLSKIPCLLKSYLLRRLPVNLLPHPAI